MNGIENRNINLDALRSFATIGVIMLHLGGGVNTLNINDGNKLIVSMILAITYCSVNLFGLLSGYLKVDRPHHNSTIIKIVFQTLFWCFVIAVVCAVALGQKDLKLLIRNAFPFTSDRLWYITCYVFVFLCVPYLNRLINSLSQSECKKMLITLAILMSFATTLLFKDFFHVVNNGYSAIWLVYMYLLGGYYKKYGFNQIIKKGHVWIVLWLCICATIVSKYILEVVFMKMNLNPDRAWQFYYYSSPLTLIIGICFLYSFVNLKINGKILIKCISWISNISLGIYIIHAHPYSLDYILIGSNLTWIVNDNPIITLISIIGCAFGIAIVTGIMEQLRMLIFKAVKIDVLCKRVGDKLDAILLSVNGR